MDVLIGSAPCSPAREVGIPAPAGPHAKGGGAEGLQAETHTVPDTRKRDGKTGPRNLPPGGGNLGPWVQVTQAAQTASKGQLEARSSPSLRPTPLDPPTCPPALKHLCRFISSGSVPVWTSRQVFRTGEAASGL